jgi:hypothetical protein
VRDDLPPAIPDGAQCRQCHYDLRGQIELRCPECGTPFDPLDRRTMRRSYRREVARATIQLARDAIRVARAVIRLLRTAWIQWVALAMVATALVAFMDLLQVAFWNNLHIAVPTFVLGWCLWIFIVVRIWKCRMALPAWARLTLKAACTGLLLIPAAFSVGTDICPHARYLIVGPHMLIFTTHGVNCGNPRTFWSYFDDLVRRTGPRSPSGRDVIRFGLDEVMFSSVILLGFAVIAAFLVGLFVGMRYARRRSQVPEREGDNWPTATC